MEPAHSQVIDDFMFNYRTGIAHYQLMAERAKKICEEKLKDQIPAIFISRAKAHDSLHQKLRRRNQRFNNNEGYQGREDILRDIADLAAMRIALYFPDQWRIVDKVIKETFDIVKAPENERKISRGTGYDARHYRVRIRQVHVGRDWTWHETDTVEIQVVSVLVHAWAEVEHDIKYKRVADEASLHEQRILDCLNGLVRSGEPLLDQLHELYQARKIPFKSTHALGAFLEQKISGRDMVQDIDQPASGGGEETLDETDRRSMEVLLKFLRVLGMDTPESLGPPLRELGFHKKTEKKLVEKYAAAYHPFTLKTSIYIMIHILSTRTSADELKISSDSSDADRCKVLISSLIWLQELFSERTEVKQALAGQERNLHWIYNHPARIDILGGVLPASADGKKALQGLWTWFERQERPVFGFVFKICRTGVLVNLPEEVKKLVISPWNPGPGSPGSAESSDEEGSRENDIERKD